VIQETPISKRKISYIFLTLAIAYLFRRIHCIFVKRLPGTPRAVKRTEVEPTIMALEKYIATTESTTLAQPQSEDTSPESSVTEKKPLKRRIREILWDSLDRTPEERWFIHKIDFFILTWASLSYFSKNLNTNNVSKSR
jgi:hypothetical protein